MNNTFIFIGRITKDLELKYSSEKKAILNLPLALNNGKDDTTYITTTVFGVLAETIGKFCKKGDLIGVSGLVKNSNWTDSNGKARHDYQFIVSKMTFLTQKKKDDDVLKELPNVKSKYEDSIQLKDEDLPWN